MGPLLHIRKNVLKLSQSDMAAIAGVSQATVSRWETGELEPDRGEMRRIREHAASAGRPWDDCWFFSVPAPAHQPEAMAS